MLLCSIKNGFEAFMAKHSVREEHEAGWIRFQGVNLGLYSCLQEPRTHDFYFFLGVPLSSGNLIGGQKREATHCVGRERAAKLGSHRWPESCSVHRWFCFPSVLPDCTSDRSFVLSCVALDEFHLCLFYSEFIYGQFYFLYRLSWFHSFLWLSTPHSE